MESVLREALQEDYEAVCALLAQVDRIHAEALPELFRPGRSMNTSATALRDGL